MYLGNDEIFECYIGNTAITEAYLGTDLVYSSGSFVGLKTIPRFLVFSDGSLVQEFKVKASEPWTITNNNQWISFSTLTGDTGETIVTATVTAQTATTVTSVTVSSTNFSATLGITFEMVRMVDYIYQENSSSYQASSRIDTEVPHTASTMTIEIEYYSLGTGTTKFSDRMVGYAQGDPGCSSDSNDFRLFGYQGGSFDYGNTRGKTSSNINTGYHHLTIGDNYCYDEDTHSYLVNGTTVGVVPSPDCHIYVDVSLIKVKRVIIRDGSTILFDGHAAIVNGKIGLWDSVSNTLKYNADITMAYDGPENYTYVNKVVASTFTPSTGVSTNITPAYPGYKVNIKGTFHSGVDFHNHMGTVLNNATAAQTDATSFAVQYIYHQGTEISYYSDDVIWDAGRYEWNVGNHSGQTIDWTLENNGIYDNNAGQYVITGLTSTAVTAKPIILGFLTMAISEIVIYDANGRVFDGKAAIRNSDLQGGLYDSISQAFYTDDNNTIVAVQ